MSLIREKLRLIEIAPEAKEKLRTKLAEWSEDKGNFNAEFSRVFQDSYVHQAEAYDLFYLLKDLAGKDQYLTPEEVEQPEFWIKQESHRHYILKPDPKTLQGAERALKYYETKLEEAIQECAEAEQTLFERSLSYWNFVSAENLWGLSAYLTHDGTPFSHNEIDGLRRAQRILRDVLFGLQIFRSQLQTGRLNPNNFFVQKFLESPLPISARTHHWLGLYDVEAEGGDDYVNSDQAKIDRSVNTQAWIVKVVNDANATRFAHELSKHYSDRFEEEEGAGYDDRLQSGLDPFYFRFFDNQAAFFANSVASLDSAALLLAGGLAAKGIVATAKGAQLAFRSYHSLKWGRYALPGVLAFGMQGSRWQRLGLTAANIVIEMVKLDVFRRGIGTLTEQTPLGYNWGVDWSSRLFMFSGGLFARLEAGAFAKVADDVIAGRSNQALDDLLKSPQSQRELENLSEKLAASRPGGNDVYQRLVERRTGLTLGPALQDRAIERLGNQLRNLGGSYAEAAGRLAKLEDKAEAIGKMEALLREARERLKKAASGKSAGTTRRTKRRTPPSVDLRKTPLERLIETSPPRIGAEAVEQATQNTVRIPSADTAEQLTSLYNTYPDRRGDVWRAVAQIASGSEREARKVLGAQGLWRIRMKGLDITYKRLADGAAEILEVSR